MTNVRLVMVATVAVTVVCISLSTLVAIGDLRQIVTESEAVKSKNGDVHWTTLRERALEHIEHLPRLPHGVHLPGHHSSDQIKRTDVNQIRAASIVADTGARQQSAHEAYARGDAITRPEGTCYVLPNTDYPGEGLVPGYNNKKNSAAECCEACLAYKAPSPDASDCNVWVWCGDAHKCGSQYRHCWLKHLPWPQSVNPTEGPGIGWTSGLLEAPVTSESVADASGGEERSFHTVTTAQGAGVMWQMRVHYYWFKKQQARCREEYGDRCQMGGFTRLLHSGKDDELSAEIPTYVVDPLPDNGRGYIVLNRPYGLLQWARQVKLKERYILMSEPDHVFLRPLQNPMRGNRPAAFPFFYIDPSKAEYLPITRKFVGELSRREIEGIAPIGSSPTFLRFGDFQKIAEPWVNTSMAIFNDRQANKEWGWVMEMYAFTIVLFNAGIGPVDLHLELAAQPPWDTKMETHGVPYAILHYTYGMDYTLAGEFTPGKIGAWRFDKRSFGDMPPPRHLLPPPRGMDNDLVRFLIDAVNEATDAIPGWDEYQQTNVATKFMSYEGW